MPKEIIKDSVIKGFELVVGWDRDAGHVQVASVAPKEPLVTEDSSPAHNGWHVTLDRGDINRLIRTLRKARDAAYGSDA